MASAADSLSGSADVGGYVVSAPAGSAAQSSSTDPTFKFVTDLAKELSAGRVELPSFPEAAARLQQVLSDDAVTSERIARVISSDAGLAARVLTLANSTLLHRGGTPVTNLKTAITRIGYEHIRTAALAYANAQLRRAPDLLSIRPQLEVCWQQGVRVAALAHAIAKESRRVRTDEAMLAGLLHNIGKVYLIARASHVPGQQPFDERSLRPWYPSIGQALIENWKLTEDIAVAVGGQLDTEREHEGPPDLQDLLIVAVNLAAQMSEHAAGTENPGQERDAEHDAAGMAAAGALGLNDSAFVRVMLESQTELEMLQAALG
jgi:HD-like signal output (HDOD) protein